MMVNLRVVKSNKKVEDFSVEALSNSVNNAFLQEYGVSLLPIEIVNIIIDNIIKELVKIDKKRISKGETMNCLTTKTLKKMIHRNISVYNEGVANKYFK